MQREVIGERDTETDHLLYASSRNVNETSYWYRMRIEVRPQKALASLCSFSFVSVLTAGDFYQESSQSMELLVADTIFPFPFCPHS